jgi:hypothetical protein
MEEERAKRMAGVANCRLESPVGACAAPGRAFCSKYAGCAAHAALTAVRVASYGVGAGREGHHLFMCRVAYG